MDLACLNENFPESYSFCICLYARLMEGGSSEVDAGDSSEPNRKRMKLGTIAEYGTALPKATTEKIRAALARFVIKKCLPFSHFENDPDIREAFDAAGLRLVKLPTAHYISTEKLNAEYKNVKVKVEKFLI